MAIKQLLYSFLINGIEVKQYVIEGTKIVWDNMNDTGNTADIVIIDQLLNLIPNLSAGMTVVISRGKLTPYENYRFRGVIKIIKNGDNLLQLSCVDNLHQYKYKSLNTSFDINIDPEEGEVSAIAQNIIERGGMTASVVPTGKTSTDATLNKFLARDQSYLNRLNALTSIVNYILFEDYDTEQIRFEPEGLTTYPETLEVGINIYNNLIWEEDIESVRNKIKIKGAYEEDTREESFNGTGSNATFTLLNTPQVTELFVDGIRKKRGVAGSSYDFDYTVDTTLNKFTFQPGSIPSSGTNNIVMKYTTLIPTPVVGSEPTSIAKYGLTQTATYTFQDIVDIYDAEFRLNSLLSHLAFAKLKTKCETDKYDLKIGNKVRVVDPINPRKTGEYIVKKIVVNYPDPLDIVFVGEDEFNVNAVFSTINERLKLLEIKDTTVSEILTQLINLSKSYRYERRFTKLEIKNITGDTLIWGHTDYGIWGAENWGTETTTSFILGHHTFGILGENKLGESGIAVRRDIVMMQNNNKYDEYLYDDEFKDATSTGTWNTTTKEISLTAGQFILTDKVFEGPVFNYFTVNMPNTTGTFTTEISADKGVTWQPVTLGQRTQFTSTDDKGVLLKIIASDTVTIKNLYDDGYGRYVESAININVEQ